MLKAIKRTRRRFLQTMVALLPLWACTKQRSQRQSVSLPEPQSSSSPTQVAQPTPACGLESGEVTGSQIEGPFFTPNSPERSSLLAPDIRGTKIVLTGYVLAINCQPIANVLLDFWQTDDAGVYDNIGYQLRGHQFTNEQGQYRLETIVPGIYSGRTRHFHVKVQAPHQRILTTQLYFPGEPFNAQDSLFSPRLLMDVQEADQGKVATFTFVLQ